jgi:uncharacterized metal-binding protein YceD (DUF177 family)
MRISVDHLTESGRRQAFTVETLWAVEAASHALDAKPEALGGHLLIVRKGRGVHVTGHVEVATSAACARCGESARVALQFDPDLEYRPSSAERETEEQELEEDELDVGWFDDGELDLGDVLCEAITLAMPSRVVCEDENACDSRFLALKSANSDEPAPSGPFAALKNLR